MTSDEPGNLVVEEIDGGVVLGLKVVPGSNKSCLAGVLDGRLKVKISAAPQRGRANESLLKFLSKQLGVQKKAVSIISGETNPVKRVQVLGVSAEKLLGKLNLK
ncbi:MAG: DUF167 domain-containing protein [Planctomycetota bacterium]|jgi:uncharacterized protein (TIGR00251 family)